mmetsp:Transcript_115119/g.325291  ORF Transcript_115119/g.325291 Transcript_115119/m.325291 type:complete len:223 (-) Transcript_115119:66-734(-)
MLSHVVDLLGACGLLPTHNVPQVDDIVRARGTLSVDKVLELLLELLLQSCEPVTQVRLVACKHASHLLPASILRVFVLAFRLHQSVVDFILVGQPGTTLARDALQNGAVLIHAVALFAFMKFVDAGMECLCLRGDRVLEPTLEVSQRVLQLLLVFLDAVKGLSLVLHYLVRDPPLVVRQERLYPVLMIDDVALQPLLVVKQATLHFSLMRLPCGLLNREQSH